MKRVLLALFFFSVFVCLPLEVTLLAARHTLYTDNFNRADNADLGASWDVESTDGNLKIVTNAVEAGANATDSTETNNAAGLSNDQWASIVIPTFASASDTRVSLTLRDNGTDKTRYEFTAALHNTYTSRIVYRNAGTNTASQTENATSWAGGDTLIAEVQGTSLSLKRIPNGGSESTLVTMTDANLASGKAGISIFATTNTEAIVDDFTAGDFTTSTCSSRVLLVGVGQC